MPTNEEYVKLGSFIGIPDPTRGGSLEGISQAGKLLKTTSGWHDLFWTTDNGCGTDEYGFSALSADLASLCDQPEPGQNAYFWTSSTYKPLNDYYPWEANLIWFSGNSSMRLYPKDKLYAFSVRCVKN